jgi:hypothetical protein
MANVSVSEEATAFDMFPKNHHYYYEEPQHGPLPHQHDYGCFCHDNSDNGTRTTPRAADTNNDPHRGDWFSSFSFPPNAEDEEEEVDTSDLSLAMQEQSSCSSSSSAIHGDSFFDGPSHHHSRPWSSHVHNAHDDLQEPPQHHHHLFVPKQDNLPAGIIMITDHTALNNMQSNLRMACCFKQQEGQHQQKQHSPTTEKASNHSRHPLTTIPKYHNSSSSTSSGSFRTANAIAEEPTRLDGASSTHLHLAPTATSTTTAASNIDGSDAWLDSLLNGPLLEVDPVLLVPFLFSPEVSSVCGQKSVDMNNDVSHHHDDTPPITVKLPVKQQIAKNRSKPRPLQDVPRDVKRKYVQDYTHLDVLSGRGGLGTKHKGNRDFHAAKMQLQPAYLNGTKFEKVKTVWKLFKTIRNKGGRFLKRDHGGDDDRWYEMHRDEAYTKCRQTLATRPPKTGPTPLL